MIYNLGNMWERNVGISFIGMARVVVITCLGTLADSMITFGMEGEKTMAEKRAGVALIFTKQEQVLQ